MHAALTRLVSGGIRNHGRAETRAVPGSGLACAWAPEDEEVTPDGDDSSMNEEMRPFSMCTVAEAGPVEVYGFITPSGDSLAVVGGEERALREAYPTLPTATEAPWYHADARLNFGLDIRYARWSGIRQLVPGSVTLFGNYEGVNVYGPPGVATPKRVYVPVGGCRFQGYELDQIDTRG